MSLSAQEAAHAAALEQISEELRVARASCRDLEKERRKQQGRERRTKDRLLEVLLWLYLVSGEDESVPLAYLQQLRTTSPSTLSWDALRHEVLEKAVALDAHQRTALCAEGSGISKSALQAAMTFRKEHSAVRWIEEQNVSKGLAPSPAEVLQQLVRPPGAAVDSPAAGETRKLSAAEKKRLQRLRRRWGLTIGRFQSRERVPLETLRQKVLLVIFRMPIFNFRGQKPSHRDRKGVPNIGPTFGPANVNGHRNGAIRRFLFGLRNLTKVRFFLSGSGATLCPIVLRKDAELYD